MFVFLEGAKKRRNTRMDKNTKKENTKDKIEKKNCNNDKSVSPLVNPITAKEYVDKWQRNFL